MMIRPSNSGTATCVATSSGLMPSSEAAHDARSQVRQSPCKIGMSRAASARTSHASSSPPAAAVAGLVPPAASTVVIKASQVPRYSIRSEGASRNEVAKIGTPVPPAASTALASASMYATFPAAYWAR